MVKQVRQGGGGVRRDAHGPRAPGGPAHQDRLPLAGDMALRGALNFGNRLNRLLRLNRQLAPVRSRSEGVKQALKTDIAEGDGWCGIRPI